MNISVFIRISGLREFTKQISLHGKGELLFSLGIFVNQTARVIIQFQPQPPDPHRIFIQTVRIAADLLPKSAVLLPPRHAEFQRGIQIECRVHREISIKRVNHMPLDCLKEQSVLTVRGQLHVRSANKNKVLLRHTDRKLTAQAIERKAACMPPDLIAVAIPVVRRISFQVVVCLTAGSCTDICLAQKPFAIPNAAVHDKSGEAQQISGRAYERRISPGGSIRRF